MMSIFGAPFAPAYAASKGGIVQLTRSLASAWARDNIQANAVLPGWIDTDLNRGAREQIPGLNWYGLAFRILSYAIVYSGLSAVRAKPNRHIAPTGAEPNYTMSFLTKEMPIVFLIAVAWHVGVIAGYL